ncbi:hypothetical protein [Propionibacterium australiense]|uniref:Uncharacterized protein n=1 Tax=Propionibacterium australiense TaxID=119981 RepID=A0A8B3FP24_9ACTN|nr:hypothetical protein [Propionibacterium australiense]RLP08912.1 hypothetical protein D7U36_08880 [Propionibacterium australiense]
MTATYSTRSEAIRREIIEPVEASGEVKLTAEQAEQIADRVLGGYGEGYACQVEDAEFWQIAMEAIEG